MKPVHGAGKTSHRVSDEIVPAHVRELVQEHRAPAVERPSVAFRRESIVGTNSPHANGIFASSLRRRRGGSSSASRSETSQRGVSQSSVSSGRARFTIRRTTSAA